MLGKLKNGVMQTQIKKYLKTQGYRSGKFQISEVELVAIQRPGWKQIFRFVVTSQDDEGNPMRAVGIANDDERFGCEYVLTKSVLEYHTLLEKWGEGMIHRKFSQNEVDISNQILFALLGITAVIILLLSVVE